MKPLNIIVGLGLIAFGAFSIAHHKRLYAEIEKSDKVPISSLEKKMVGQSKEKIQVYGLAKYMLAQVFIILFGFLFLASGLN